jgi:hypothetical protein
MTTESSTQMSRWHWIWIVPLSLSAVLVAEAHTIPFGFDVLKLAWHRWTWAGLFSPSAHFCWLVVLASVFYPVIILSVAIGHLAPSINSTLSTPRRCVYILLAIVTIVLLPFVTDALIWGSFPFTIDSSGAHRLRLIPFIPWPDVPFGQI